MFYHVHHMRGGNEIAVYTAWCPETYTGSIWVPNSANRNFLGAGDANLVPQRLGKPSFDWAGFMIWFVPSNYSHLVDFIQVGMQGRMLVLGDTAKNGDLLLLDNGNGFRLNVGENLQHQFTTIGFTVVMNGATISSSSTSNYGLTVVAEATLNAVPLPFPSRNVENGSNRAYYSFQQIVVINENDMRYGAFYGDSSIPVTITVPENYGYTVEEFFNGVEPVDMDDPYSNIPDSTPSGPAEGTGIPESDPVDFPALPTFSVTDTGFITLFNPTMGQVKDLADYMWNGLFDVNTFKKLFADPMDCILGFNMVPVAVPSGAAANINIGNIVTSVSMNTATSQWVELDCGSIDIGLPYGSYLDFSPYTKFSIYLPYIGTCDLSTDDVAGKVLTLKYHVDALSCSCVAYLKCGDHVLYQWTGACGYSIPITQNDFSRMIMSIINIAAAGIGGAVTGGAGAAIMNAGAAAAKNVMNLKPDVHRTGTIGSGAGLMGGQTPYLIIEIPNACKPKKQYHFQGYPGFITTKIGDLTGYAEFETVILDGIGCTEEERGIIENLLMGGVFV